MALWLIRGEILLTAGLVDTARMLQEATLNWTNGGEAPNFPLRPVLRAPAQALSERAKEDSYDQEAEGFAWAAPPRRRAKDEEPIDGRRAKSLWSVDDLPPTPPGFCAVDFLGATASSRLPRRRGRWAARELRDLVQRGLIEAERRGSALYARPAIVSVLAVSA